MKFQDIARKAVQDPRFDQLATGDVFEFGKDLYMRTDKEVILKGASVQLTGDGAGQLNYFSLEFRVKVRPDVILKAV